MELFKLFGSIMVDNKKANESISKTGSLAGKLGQGLGKGIKTAAKWGAAITAGAAAGGTALFGVTKNAADTGDRIDKLSQKIGMSRKGFQQWDYILSQNGMSIESLQGGMKKMNKNLDDAKQGSQTAVEAFSRIGLSVDDLKNASPEEAFEMTVKALQGMPDGAEKAALANELLGRSGSELMPLLNGSAESVEELKKQAEDMGIVLSDDAVDASVKFTDTLDNAKRSLGAIVAKIGVSVMPLFQSFLDWVLSNMPLIQSVMTTVFNVINEAVTIFINIFKDYLLPVFKSIVDFVVEHWPQISQVIESVFEAVKIVIDVISNVFKEILLPAFNYVVDWVKENWPYISEIISSVFELVKAIFNQFVNTISFLWNSFGQNIMNIVKIAFNTMSEIIKSVMQVVRGILQVVTGAIKGDWSSVWNGIKNIISGVWNAIKAIVDGRINTIKNIIQGGFNLVKSIVSNIWNGIKTAIMTPINSAADTVKNAIDRIKSMFNFSFNWPHLPMPHFYIDGSMNPLKWLEQGVPTIGVDWYAKGGIFDKPTIFNTVDGLKGVGEKGPEAVTPISKLQEMIDWNTGKDTELLNKIIELLMIIVNKDPNFYIDGTKISKELAPYFDNELYKRKQREVF